MSSDEHDGRKQQLIVSKQYGEDGTLNLGRQTTTNEAWAEDKINDNTNIAERKNNRTIMRQTHDCSSTLLIFQRSQNEQKYFSKIIWNLLHGIYSYLRLHIVVTDDDWLYHDRTIKVSDINLYIIVTSINDYYFFVFQRKFSWEDYVTIKDDNNWVVLKYEL